MSLFFFKNTLRIAAFYSGFVLISAAFCFDNITAISTNLPSGSVNTHPALCKTSYTAVVVADSDAGSMWQKAIYVPVESSGAPGPVGSSSGTLCPGIYSISGQIVVTTVGGACSASCGYHIVFDAVNSSGTRTTEWDYNAGTISNNASIIKTFSGGSYNTNDGVLSPPRVTNNTINDYVVIGPSQLLPWASGGANNGDIYYGNTMPINYVRLTATTIFNAH